MNWTTIFIYVFMKTDALLLQLYVYDFIFTGYAATCYPVFKSLS